MLGETNSVSFMFDRVGQIVYPAAAAQRRRRCSKPAVEAGADDVESGDERACRAVRASDDLNAVRDALEQRFGAAAVGAARVAAENLVAGRRARPRTRLFKLLETLEDSDDVQNVYANFEVADDVMARLSA